MTADGLVPHKRHPNGFLMPVMLEIPIRSKRTAGAMTKPLSPLRDEDGRFIYALPGGGCYVE